MMERQHTHTAAMAGVGNGNQRPWRKSKATLVGHKVFLGGLDRSSTSNSIMSYFSSFGEVIDAWQESKEVYVRTPYLGRRKGSAMQHIGLNLMPRGFGFVVFEDEHAAEVVLELVNHHLDGRDVQAKEAIATDRGAPVPGSKADLRVKTASHKVFVKWSMGTEEGFSGDDDLFTSVQHFLPGIEEAKVLLDRDTGRVRKAGFFTFGTEEQAMACTRMRFLKVSGRNTILMHVAEGNSPGSRFDLDKSLHDDDDGSWASFSYGPDRRRHPGRNASDFDHRMPPFYRRHDQGRRRGKLGGNQQQPPFEYQQYQHSPVDYQHYFWNQAQIAYQFHLQQCMQAHHFAQQKMALGLHEMACQQNFDGFNNQNPFTRSDQSGGSSVGTEDTYECGGHTFKKCDGAWVPPHELANDRRLVRMPTSSDASVASRGDTHSQHNGSTPDGSHGFDSDSGHGQDDDDGFDEALLIRPASCPPRAVSDGTDEDWSH